MSTEEVIARLDWARIGTQLDEEGFAILPGLLSESQVRDHRDCPPAAVRNGLGQRMETLSFPPCRARGQNGSGIVELGHR